MRYFVLSEFFRWKYGKAYRKGKKEKYVALWDSQRTYTYIVKGRVETGERGDSSTVQLCMRHILESTYCVQLCFQNLRRQHSVYLVWSAIKFSLWKITVLSTTIPNQEVTFIKLTQECLISDLLKSSLTYWQANDILWLLLNSAQKR